MYGIVKTEIIDTLINAQTGERQVIHQGKNALTVGYGLLVAGLLANESTYTGLKYFAIGQGEGVSWDSLTTSQRQAKSLFSLTQLYDEIARVEVAIVYLDENNLEVPGPTNKIEIRGAFSSEISGSVREFGIFGGDATETADSGVMIDHKAHGLISLNEDSALEQILLRAVRITVL